MDATEDLSSLLTERELERASRYRDPRRRARFIAARGLLRRLLGSRDDFALGRYGKPYDPLGRVRFNASSSESLALFAISEAREVGVDVQRVDPSFPTEALIRDNCAAEERESARADFTRIWVRKESAIKAVGLGLHWPLSTVVVLNDRLVDPEGREVRLWDVPVRDGWRGAVAVVYDR